MSDLSAATAAVYGHFRILQNPEGRPWQLGRGSFGTVFRARDERTGVEVALKVIHDRFLTDERERRRFREEARQHRRLTHENVVRILDVGESEDCLFLAMDLCLGGDLHHWTAGQGRVPAPLALALLRPIADALVYASAYGLVHRDLKPSNILLVNPTPPGEVPKAKLADFGLAKKVWREVSGESLAMSQSGGIKGTLQFASPEQVREDDEIDVRSDIFSFGLTLWYLLHGGYPFSEQKVHQFIKERSELESYRHRFPSAWPNALQDFMAKIVVGPRDQRFPDFARLVHALDDCLEQLMAQPPKSGTTPDAVAIARPEGGPPPPSRPLPIREFFSLQLIEQNSLGSLYEARPIEGGPEDGEEPRQLELLRRNLPAPVLDEIRATVRKLSASPHPGLASVSLQKHVEGEAVVIGVSPQAPNLLDNIRLTGPRRAVEVLPWLEQVALALDHAASLDIPGVETAPGAVTLVPTDQEGVGRLVLTARLCRNPDQSGEAGIAGTMGGTLGATFIGGASGPDAAEPASWASTFSRLAYWLFAAHGPKDAALATPTAYVSCSTLSEPSNAVLRDALCGRYHGRCVDVLAALAAAEGLNFTAPPPAVTAATAPSIGPLPSRPASDPVPSPPSERLGGSGGSLNVSVLKDILSELEKEQRALNEEKRRREQVEADLLEERRQKQLLEERNNELAREKADLQARVGTLNEHIEHLNTQKDEAQCDRDRLEADVHQLIEREKHLLARQEEIRSDLDSKEKEIEAARLATVGAEALVELEAQMAALRERKVAQDDHLTRLREDLTLRNSSLEDANRRIRDLENEKLEKDNQITALIAQGDLGSSELAREIDRRRSNEARLEAELADSRRLAADQLAALQRELEAARIDADKRRRDADALAAEQKASRDRESATKQQLDAEVRKRKELEKLQGGSPTKRRLLTAAALLVTTAALSWAFFKSRQPTVVAPTPVGLTPTPQGKEWSVLVKGTLGAPELPDDLKGFTITNNVKNEKDGSYALTIKSESADGKTEPPDKLKDRAGTFPFVYQKGEKNYDAPANFIVNIDNPHAIAGWTLELINAADKQVPLATTSSDQESLKCRISPENVYNLRWKHPQKDILVPIIAEIESQNPPSEASLTSAATTEPKPLSFLTADPPQTVTVTMPDFRPRNALVFAESVVEVDAVYEVAQKGNEVAPAPKRIPLKFDWILPIFGFLSIDIEGTKHTQVDAPQVWLFFPASRILELLTIAGTIQPSMSIGGGGAVDRLNSTETGSLRRDVKPLLDHLRKIQTHYTSIGELGLTLNDKYYPSLERQTPSFSQDEAEAYDFLLVNLLRTQTDYYLNIGSDSIKTTRDDAKSLFEHLKRDNIPGRQPIDFDRLAAHWRGQLHPGSERFGDNNKSRIIGASRTGDLYVELSGGALFRKVPTGPNYTSTALIKFTTIGDSAPTKDVNSIEFMKQSNHRFGILEKEGWINHLLSNYNNVKEGNSLRKIELSRPVPIYLRNSSITSLPSKSVPR